MRELGVFWCPPKKLGRSENCGHKSVGRRQSRIETHSLLMGALFGKMDGWYQQGMVHCKHHAVYSSAITRIFAARNCGGYECSRLLTTCFIHGQKKNKRVVVSHAHDAHQTKHCHNIHWVGSFIKASCVADLLHFVHAYIVQPINVAPIPNNGRSYAWRPQIPSDTGLWVGYDRRLHVSHLKQTDLADTQEYP